MKWHKLATTGFFCLILAGCKPAGKGGGTSRSRTPRTAGRAPSAGPVLIAPRAWMEAHRALTLLGRQTDQSYAVTPRDFEGLVGPFEVGAKLSVAEFLRAVAAATGTEIVWRGKVAVFQPPQTPAGKKRFAAALADLRTGEAGKVRGAAFVLSESFRLEAVPPLVAALKSEDAAVRRSALLALAEFEGDFAHNEWPGRLSIFELPGVKLDVDTLMWVTEEAAAPGGSEWLGAVSLLGRAREGQLGRSIWWHPWGKTQGAIMPSIWAMGRCGDPDMRATLDKRMRRTFTNVHTDRFRTAEAVARMGMVGTLTKHANPKYPALVRCAAAYGLGLVGESKTAFEALKGMLKDRDARVRQVAVLSLVETNSPEAIGLLSKTLLDPKADVTLRCAAAGVIGSFSLDEIKAIGAEELIAEAAKAKDPRVRAAVAEALGELGGVYSQGKLAGMLTDKDRWVRAAAGRALTSIGQFWASDRALVTDIPYDKWAGFGARLLDSKADVEVRTAIAIGMGQGRDPEAAGLLAKVALNPKEDWRLRKYAARGLAMLANRAGQSELKKLLEMKRGAITDIPLRYLDLGGPARTTAYLAPWVTRGRGRSQQSCAIERVGELGTPEGVALLCAGFNAFNNYTRCTNAYSLQANQTAANRRAMIHLLKTSRRSGVRTNAALGLTGARDPAAVDALVRALSDRSAGVRMAAINSLGNCGDPAAAGGLVKRMLEDKNLRVAHQALRALRMRGYAELGQVREAFEKVRGTDRDCGVPGGPPITQQKDNTWVLRKYYRTYGDLTLPNLTYESTISYDPGTRRMVQWGAHGRRSDAPQTGMTWVLDPRTATWVRPLSREEPPGTCCNRDIVTDEARGIVISPKSGMGGHGWVMTLRKRAAYSVPWTYDVRKGQWYPMRPVYHPGSHGMVATCYDRRNDAIIVHGGRERIYDTHTNTWTTMRPPAPYPREHSQQPGAYDPLTGRFIMVADRDSRGRGRTWAYSLAENRWTELKAKNPPPAMRQPMVYDSANDVMLAFRNSGGRFVVHVYHIRENRWEEMPASYPSPSYHMTDTVYDPVNNVTWMIGGWEWGQSGAVTTRETWTYRYRRASKPRSTGEPRGLRLLAPLKEDGPPQLKWGPPAGGQPAGYHVYRGEGPQPWTAKWTRLTKAPIKDAGLALAPRDLAKPYYYRVTAIGADGKESVPSLLARTRPVPVRRVFAARRADGSVRVTWEPSPGPVTAGYNVYRAAAPATNLWSRSVRLGDLAKQFVKITKKPVRGAGLVDRPGGDRPSPACETRWAPFYVYVVRAVSAHGLESGPSPATLSIPAAPGPVLVARLGDGRRLILSGEGDSEVRGHHFYRMDVYKGDLIFRRNGAPSPGTVFVDTERWPVGHRRQYFVVPVDGAGQLGVPSSPGWEELP
jgi:HEAT repeat protein